MTEEETKLWKTLKQLRIQMRLTSRNSENYGNLKKQLEQVKRKIVQEMICEYRGERENYGEYKRK